MRRSPMIVVEPLDESAVDGGQPHLLRPHRPQVYGARGREEDPRGVAHERGDEDAGKRRNVLSISPARNYMAIADGRKTLAQLRMENAAAKSAGRHAEKLLSPARKTINKALTRAAPMRRS
jgi:hypothetical protein